MTLLNYLLKLIVESTVSGVNLLRTNTLFTIGNSNIILNTETKDIPIIEPYLLSFKEINFGKKISQELEVMS